MKRIVLITLGTLVLLATAAAAHQSGWGHRNHGNVTSWQQVNTTGGGCPTNTNMMGQRMKNQVMMGTGMQGDTTSTTSTNNWRVNPAYQGQVGTSTTGK
ncbi:MAG: hypothetical protein JRJ37_00275 [Deltaproteobacteria bacterium]|nr:hypothetical protein [Deltaproteobacteria bacterium]